MKALSMHPLYITTSSLILMRKQWLMLAFTSNLYTVSGACWYYALVHTQIFMEPAFQYVQLVLLFIKPSKSPHTNVLLKSSGNPSSTIVYYPVVSYSPSGFEFFRYTPRAYLLSFIKWNSLSLEFHEVL